MTPIKFWPTSREPEFGEGAGSLHKSVRPVWVGGNINWLARELGAYTLIRKSDRSGSARMYIGPKHLVAQSHTVGVIIGTLVGTLDIELRLIVKTETLTWLIISCKGRGGTSEVQQFEWSHVKKNI